MSLPVPKYGDYWPVLARQWDAMKIKPARAEEVSAVAHRLHSHKETYQDIEKATGVPWSMIAVIHEREASGDFTKQLAQGWSLRSRSEWKPYIGPFPSFKAGAIAALKYDDIIGVPDWRIEKQLYRLIGFNGWGYYLYHNDMPSPYIFGATSVQKIGKYVADKKWSATTWDTQIGCAALLRAIATIDPTVIFTRED